MFVLFSGSSQFTGGIFHSVGLVVCYQLLLQTLFAIICSTQECQRDM